MTDNDSTFLQITDYSFLRSFYSHVCLKTVELDALKIMSQNKNRVELIQEKRATQELAVSDHRYVCLYV